MGLLSIRAKLFFALLLASLLATLGTVAFLRWSLQQGLGELVDARESERIGEIAERLTAIYARDGGWERLRDDKRMWIAALLGRGHWLAQEQGDLRPRHLPPWMRRALDWRGDWPPEHAIRHLRPSGGSGPEPEGDSSAPERDEQDRRPPREGRHGRWDDARDDRPVPLPLRLMLLDASGSCVYGRESLLPSARRIPIEQDGRQIGTLALLPGRPIAELPELQFQASQGGRLWVGALAMLAVSAALAVPLSRRLVRPVRRFQEAARRLAAGDYAARVAVQGSDELSRLGRDINALAAALERTEQARRRWVADISHELRTPIALLRAELEAIQDGVRTLDRARVDALHGDVLRLGRLVDDLHDLSLTDLGALSYRMTPSDPGEVLETDLDAFRPRFAAAGLALRYEDRRPAPHTIQADPDRLSQLFRNLLRNSLQYTDRGGGLSVTLEQAGDRLRLDFDDTPPGVPADALPRLFDRLYRVDASRNRNTGGAGLGLAIAKNIVEAHGGTVSAAPSPAGGLRIRIELRT